MNKIFCILLSTGTLILSGCVTPEVVASRVATDARISCAGIAAERSKLNNIRVEAKKGKSLSTENVVAGLFFWPAVIGNSMNASEAIEAVNAREVTLAELANKKGC